MPKLMRSTHLACALAVSLGLLLPSSLAFANATAGFDSFCSQWMGKLAERERTNRDQAQTRSGSGSAAIEYTGYAKEAQRCEARVNAKGAPSIGILVYEEMRYRKTGASEPTVVERVEVTEVFRYDGSRWTY